MHSFDAVLMRWGRRELQMTSRRLLPLDTSTAAVFHDAFLGVVHRRVLPVLAQDSVTPVSVVEVTTAPLSEEIPLTGSVTARRSSRISPKLDGFVAEVLVEEGDRVRAGAPLLKLDRVMAEIELSRAQAELEEAAGAFKGSETPARRGGEPGGQKAHRQNRIRCGRGGGARSTPRWSSVWKQT